MREFRFNLDKLLELRRYEEREWELKLAQITGECLLLEQKIQTNRERISKGAGTVSAGGGVIDLQALLAGNAFINRLYHEITVYSQELEEKNKKRAEVSAEYLTHSRRRKVLDKLKEKKSTAYYKEQIQEEFKILDDVNNGARIRNNTQGRNI